MASAVASGALRWGQCPVASSSTISAAGMASRTYSPTATGAITSCVHCSTRVGTVTVPRSTRLSDRNVTSANCRAMAGSVRQKLSVSSSPSSGRSAFPTITGAIALDHPR